MKRIIFFLFAIIISASLLGQKYLTKDGEIEIYSKTSLFTIEAKNKKVASILDASNGALAVSTLVRSFKFKEALVEEHFNENYMESHKFPKSFFKGTITNFSLVNLKKDGEYSITIEGDLTMHGETRPIKENGMLVVKNGELSGNITFNVSLENYKIEVEPNYKDRIKDEIKLIVNFSYNPV